MHLCSMPCTEDMGTRASGAPVHAVGSGPAWHLIVEGGVGTHPCGTHLQRDLGVVLRMLVLGFRRRKGQTNSDDHFLVHSH